MSVVRTYAFSALVLAGLLAAPRAWAGPSERFEEDFRECTLIAQASPGEFSCPICGVISDCSQTECSWGAITFDRNTQAVIEGMDRGFPIYCAQAGGVLFGPASMPGRQMAAFASALSADEDAGTTRQRSGLTMGASGQYAQSRYNNPARGDETSRNAIGGAIPLATTIDIGRAQDIELSGMIIAGRGDGLTQFGVAGTPMYMRTLVGGQDVEDVRVFAGAGVPFHFVGTTHEDSGFGLSWSLGAMGVAGVSKRVGDFVFGGGAVLDARWVNGFLLPAQVMTRVAYAPLAGWGALAKVVVQPGLSTELTTDVVDALQGNLLAGLQFGQWIVGYQGNLTTDSTSHGLGVRYVGLGGKVVSRGDDTRFEPIDPSIQTADTGTTSTASIAIASAEPSPEPEVVEPPAVETPEPEPEVKAPEPEPPPPPVVSVKEPEPEPPPPPPPVKEPEPEPPPPPPVKVPEPEPEPPPPPVKAPEPPPPPVKAPEPPPPPVKEPEPATPEPSSSKFAVFDDDEEEEPPPPPAVAEPKYKKQSHFIRAVKSVRRRQIAVAEGIMWEAIAAEPKVADHIFDLARVLKLAKRKKRAREALAFGRQRFPKDPRFKKKLKDVVALPPEAEKILGKSR